MDTAVQKIVDYRIQQARAGALNTARETQSIEGINPIKETIETFSSHSKGNISRIKNFATLALKHRKSVEEGELSVFLVAFVFAAGKDGFFDFIPFFGTAFAFPITIYLIIFLWGKGTWKWKVFRLFLLFFDLFVPFLKMLPISFFCVSITYYHAKKNAEKAKIKLKQLGIPA